MQLDPREKGTWHRPCNAVYCLLFPAALCRYAHIHTAAVLEQVVGDTVERGEDEGLKRSMGDEVEGPEHEGMRVCA